MSTIPNRYYNSPFIQAAGENLASALAPQDPEKTLAAKRAAWSFDQAQQQAQIGEDTRQKRIQADAMVEDLLAMPPVKGEDGKIDETATEQAAREKFGKIIELGGREYFDVASKAAGTASPTFAAAEALKNLALQSSQQNLASNIAAAFERQHRDQTFRGSQQEDQQQFLTDQQGRELDAEMAREMARIQSREKMAREKSGGKPTGMFGGKAQDVVMAILRKIKVSGRQMTPEDRDKLYSLGNKYAQQFNDAQTGANLAWDQVFPGSRTYTGAQSGPGPEQPPPSGYLGRVWSAMTSMLPSSGADDSYLHPAFPNGESSLGDVVTPPAAGPSAPTAAPQSAPAPTPQSSAPPARLLKEGVETTFKGKGTWTLRNGAPVRVR